MSLLFGDLVKQSLLRSARWHQDTAPWSLLEWAGAMAGEAGESCNQAKKVKRLETGIQNLVGGTPVTDLELARNRAAMEAADTLIYAVHVIANAGYDPEEIVRDVFNRKSAEYSFPERI